MVAWWWIPIVLSLGGIVGFTVAALMGANHDGSDYDG